MYNLLIQGVPWGSDHDTVSSDRLFEFTDDRVRAKYNSNGQPDFDALQRLPCLFMQEGRGPDQLARLCRLTSIRSTPGVIHIDFIPEPGMPVLNNREIYNARTAFGLDDDFEFNRTHWAVKDVNLYRTVLRAQRPTRTSPKVFKIADREAIDPYLISVMMPFDTKYRKVFDTIREHAPSIGMKCLRGDDLWDNDAVIQDVVDLIDRSKIVICDCTGRNANVFYEAGIAHCLGRSVIFITQNKSDVPFDVGHLRYVEYLNNEEGRADLWEKLKTRISKIIESD